MITFDQALLTGAILSHDEILKKLKSQCRRIDFQERAYPQCAKLKKEIFELKEKIKSGGVDLEKTESEIARLETQLDEFKVKSKHYLIITIEEILSVAQANNWDMCMNCGFIYLYNGAYWKAIDEDGLQKFFGEVAELLSVPMFEARHYQFRENLKKQFLAVAHLPKPKKSKRTILVNFQNGTLEIKSGKTILRDFAAKDFLTYQLPFDYDPQVNYPLWQSFLDTVIADKEKQNVLAEYFASAFVNNSIIKLEKVLMLFGTGSNGKGVVFEVMSALFGEENISNFSLSSLTDEKGYFVAKIIDKLVNYSSENGLKLDSNIFKQLASGEPVGARLPHGHPFQATDYAKLVFNTNILPRDGVEQTDAFFRRFLIIPFDVVIAEEKQDKELHLKIIGNELPGVFNWVIEGLHRLLKQKGYSKCDAAVKKLNEYRTQSDSVRSFIEDKGYKRSINGNKRLKDVYGEYSNYCHESGARAVGLNEFSTRLRSAGFETKRSDLGMVIYLTVDVADVANVAVLNF